MTITRVSTDGDETTYSLGNDEHWTLFVNERRVLVRCRRKCSSGWTVLSSAVLNGGLKIFPPSISLQILNAKVPIDFDGLDPEPKELLRQLARKEYQERETHTNKRTIGLLTAASMKTVC
jgi:Adenosylcobinamide amidohydrolase